MDTSANVITTMGILSELVYNDKKDKDGNSINYFQIGKTLEVNGITYTVKDFANTANDMQALLLESGGQYVIAFRGTASLLDAALDGIIGFNNINGQYADAVAFVQAALNKPEISTSNLTLTGHSLGGILTQQVGATLGLKGYAYNPYGVDRLLSMPADGNIFNAINDVVVYHVMKAVGLGATESAWAKNNILNVSYNDFGTLNGDILSNLATELTSGHVGSYLPIYGDDKGLDGHSMIVLNAAITHYNTVLSNFTNKNYNLLTAAYVSVGDYEKTEKIFSDAGVYNQSITGLSFNFLIDDSPSEIATKAKSNPAVLYALAKLNPFAVVGNLPAYAQFDPSEYSKSYVKDRAQYLYYSIDPNERYYKYRTDSHHYEDSTMPDKVLKKGYSVSRILFGGDGNSTLNGLDQEDHLYGMGGEDTLTGNGGADYIEGGKGGDTLKGGAGNDILVGSTNSIYDDEARDTLEGGDDFDTYFVNNSDVIKDSDGKGLVKFEGIDLTGKKYKNKQTGLYEDNDYIYNGNPKTKGTLTVIAKKGSKRITIQEWSNKDLGIELTDTKDIDVSITKSASASEGDSGKRSLSFTVTLSRALEDGESLNVSVSSTDEGSYTFTSGEKSHTFTHSWQGDTWDEGAIDHTATLTPTASYSGPTKDIKVKILNSGTVTVYDDDEDERHDPLALDMNMDGFISTTALETSGTYFDITGDGLRERVGWIQSEDALLTYDKNENAQIDGIDEVFGNANESGFEELKRTIDSNHDNKIDRRDELFAQLQVWNDANQDAKVQEGELKSLSDAKITAIDLNYVSTNIEINGNLLTEASKYTDTEGNKELAADIQLATDAKDTKVDINDIPDFTIDPITNLLPQLRGSGLVYDSFIRYNMDPEFKAIAVANNQIHRKVA